jgi:putative redox protein
VAYTATKRGIAVAGLEVDVTGTYDGPRFSAFRIEVRATEPGGAELARLIETAKRVCYVTRTLAEPPEIEFVVG